MGAVTTKPATSNGWRSKWYCRGCQPTRCDLQGSRTHADGESGEQGARSETPLDIDLAKQDTLSLAPVVFAGPKYGACDVLEETVVCPVVCVVCGIGTCGQGTNEEKLDFPGDREEVEGLFVVSCEGQPERYDCSPTIRQLTKQSAQIVFWKQKRSYRFRKGEL